MRALFLGIAFAFAVSAASADTVSLAHTITVDGEASIYADPDHASMNFGIVTGAATVGEALRANNQKMDSVLGALRGIGVKDSELQTSTFSIQPLHPRIKDGGYDYNQISGYEVTNSITVTVSDLKKVGPVIDAAANLGATTSNSVVFEVNNREELLDKVRVLAMKNAKHKADLLAGAVGATVGPLITVGSSMVATTEREFAPAPPLPPPPPPPAPGTSILPGQLTISANVTAVFALK